MSKIEEVADVFLKERKDAVEAPQREASMKWDSWLNDNRNEKFYNRLTSDHPDLFDEAHQYGRPMMHYLGEVAKANGLKPLEEIWKDNEWSFVRGERPTPPSSLNPNAGDVGIPATPQPPSSGPDQGPSLRDRVIQLERARRRIA